MFGAIVEMARKYTGHESALTRLAKSKKAKEKTKQLPFQNGITTKLDDDYPSQQMMQEWRKRTEKDRLARAMELQKQMNLYGVSGSSGLGSGGAGVVWHRRTKTQIQYNPNGFSASYEGEWVEPEKPKKKPEKKVDLGKWGTKQ